MQAIQWQATERQYLIAIDRDLIDKEELLEVLRWLRLRFLVQKADFESDIEGVGEEILSEWWDKNQQRFIPTEE